MQHYLRLLLTGLIIIITSNLPAQNVGINTTLPHASAVLDIQSTTRGVLIPRMTSTERFAISNPATGLIVFDHTTNSIWFRRPGSWEEVMDFTNARWDEVGGTLIPKDGMRVSISPGGAIGFGRLNVVEETAASSSIVPIFQLFRSTTGTAGPGIGGSIDFLTEQSNGAFPTSARIVSQALNTTPASHTSSLEFFISAGGTINSALYLGPANVGIGTSVPSIFSKLDVNGTINANGKITRGTVTGNANLVPLCYGAIDAAGNITSGTGNFSVLKTSTGVYLFTNPDIDENCIANVTSRSVNAGTLTARMFTSTFSFGSLYVAAFNSSGTLTDSGFHFTVYKL
jgi:hypothetical protein